MSLPARAANFELTATPSTKEAQAIADELYAGFVSEVRVSDPGVGRAQLALSAVRAASYASSLMSSMAAGSLTRLDCRTGQTGVDLHEILGSGF